MYISHLISKGNASKTSLLTSMIEPDGRSTQPIAELVTKKIPLADKTQIKEYKNRADAAILNTPCLIITQSSDFYLTIQLQKGRNFEAKDLVKLPFHKRARLL